MMQPCNNTNCIHWDSDKNGGHCMLINQGWHFNEYTLKSYCESFKAMVIDRKVTKVSNNKKPRG